MAWAKIDDGMHRKRKVRGLSDAAWRLYVSAIIDCCAEGSDGVIEGWALRELLPHHHEDHVRALLSRGLLHDAPGCENDTCLSSQDMPIPGSDLYVVHDFHQWQLTTDEWDVRKRASEKGNHVRHHEKKGVKKQGCRLCYPASASDRSPNGSPERTPYDDRSPDLTRPDLTRPDPSSLLASPRVNEGFVTDLQTAREKRAKADGFEGETA